MFIGDLTGKEMQKRGDICVRITDSLAIPQETNTKLLSNYTPIKSNLKKKISLKKKCDKCFSVQSI